MGSGQSEPTDPSTLTTCLSQSRKPRDEPQSEPTDKKRPRSQAQMASLARAQQSAKEKRRIRDKQREVDKVSSIAQEVARIGLMFLASQNL